jgi:hypothetical protein
MDNHLTEFIILLSRLFPQRITVLQAKGIIKIGIKFLRLSVAGRGRKAGTSIRFHIGTNINNPFPKRRKMYFGPDGRLDTILPDHLPIGSMKPDNIVGMSNNDCFVIEF